MPQMPEFPDFAARFDRLSRFEQDRWRAEIEAYKRDTSMRERQRMEEEMEERMRMMAMQATPLMPRLTPAWAAQQFGGLGDVVERKSPVDVDKLAKLKASEPYKVTQRMPDMVECITAWRAWRVTNKGGLRLQALGKDHIWLPKQMIEAACTNSTKHSAPSWDCKCGVWAFKELDSLVEAVQSYSDIPVLGNVSLWGRVIETENGYRAEKAYPKELWLFSTELEELGLIYDVPVRLVG